MARPIRIQVKQLKELRAAIKRGETAVNIPRLRTLLATALMLIKDDAYRRLKEQTQTAAQLPEGWEHIEDALIVQEGKASRVATAFCKVFRRRAPQAFWIEYGHRIVGHKPGKKDTGGKVEPKPFFRPAVVAMRAAVRKAIRTALQAFMAEGFGFGKPVADTGDGDTEAPASGTSTQSRDERGRFI